MATLQSLMELGRLSRCAWECTRQSRWKETSQRFLADALPRCAELQSEVLEGRYRVSPTTDFPLNERGHLRWIEAPAVRDRIVQKSLMRQVLTPRLRPYVIYDNYASLAGRGTSFARKRFEIQLRRYISKHGTDGYILLGDIRKYFENVDHGTLKRLLAPRLEGEPQEVVSLIHYMIDTASKTSRGLNLGSECPQIFAVYYLNPLDQFVKVVRSVKYYGRYMDDFFVIGRTKRELEALLDDIRRKLSELGLEINDKKTRIVRLRRGFTWLQVKYGIEPTGRIVKRMSHGKAARERRRLLAFRRLFARGVMSGDDIWQCYRSWRGSVVGDHNACRRTVRSTDRLCASLFPPHGRQPRPPRSAIVKAANREAETQDLKYCLTF